MARLVITLIEKGNEEAPNIGTIICDGSELVKATDAIESHFDQEVEKIVFADGESFQSVRNSDPITATVLFADVLNEGQNETAQIEIQETWLY